MLFFKSIKAKVVAYLTAWVVILLSAHIFMGLKGEGPFTWRYVSFDMAVAAIPLLLFAVYIYSRILKPLEELSGVMRSVVHGIQPESPLIAGDDEFGLVNREFNAMLQALHQRDIILKGMTERLQAQNRELTEINERLVVSDKVKTQFLATVTHELKTPLSTISGYSEMMLSGIGGDLGAPHRDFTEEITASAFHLLQIINDVLDFSKAAAGTMELMLERFNLEALVKEAEMVVHPMLRKKGHSFEVSLSPDAFEVTADRLRIKQVILNLLSNAVKFTPEGGKVSVRSFRQDGQWGIVVRDNGIGIREEDFSRVFEPFSQVDQSYSRNYEGTGLGLAICRRIVGMHGGKIWMESEPGKGSSFYFAIPEDLQPGLKREREASACE